MEEIEYLEEYEDLVLPAINSAADAAATAKSSKSVNVDNDGSSSSLDQDIFNCLFDDNSDDDNDEQQQPLKEQEIFKQKVSTGHSLNESNDLLKDLGEQVLRECSIKGKGSTKGKKQLSSLTSAKTKTVTSVRPTVQQKTQLQKYNTSNQKTRHSYATASKPNLKGVTSKLNPSTTYSARHFLVANTSSFLPISSSSTSKLNTSRRPKPSFNKQRPATIVKPEKIVTKDPAEDPLNLDDLSSAESANYSVSDISGETYNSISDFDDDDYDFTSHIDALDDDDDESSNSEVIDISNDSSESRSQFEDLRGSTPSPVVSEDRDLPTNSLTKRSSLPKFMANHEIIKSLLTKGEKPKLQQLINEHDKTNNLTNSGQESENLELSSSTVTTKKDLPIKIIITDPSLLSTHINKGNNQDAKSPEPILHGTYLKDFDENSGKSDTNAAKPSKHDNLPNQEVGAEMEIANEDLIEVDLNREDGNIKDSRNLEQTTITQNSNLEKQNQSTKVETKKLETEKVQQRVQTPITNEIPNAKESTSPRPRKKRFKNVVTPDLIGLKGDKSAEIISDTKCNDPSIQLDNACITNNQEGSNYILKSSTVLAVDCETKMKTDHNVTTIKLPSMEPFKSPTKGVDKSNKNSSNRDRFCDKLTDSSRDTLNKHLKDVPRGVIMNPFVQRTTKNTFSKDGRAKTSRESSRDNSRESSVESSKSSSRDRYEDNIKSCKLVRSEITASTQHESRMKDLRETIKKTDGAEKPVSVDTKKRETPKRSNDIVDRKTEDRTKTFDKDICKSKSVAIKDIETDAKRTTHSEDTKKKDTSKKTIDIEERKSDIRMTANDDVINKYIGQVIKDFTGPTIERKGTTEKIYSDKSLQPNQGDPEPSNLVEDKQSTSPFKPYKEQLKSDTEYDLPSKCDNIDRKNQRLTHLRSTIGIDKMSQNITDSSRLCEKSNDQKYLKEKSHHSQSSPVGSLGSNKKFLTANKEALVDVVGGGINKSTIQKSVQKSPESLVKSADSVKSTIEKGVRTDKIGNKPSIVQSNTSLITASIGLKVLGCDKKILEESKTPTKSNLLSECYNIDRKDNICRENSKGDNIKDCQLTPLQSIIEIDTMPKKITDSRRLCEKSSDQKIQSLGQNKKSLTTNKEAPVDVGVGIHKSTAQKTVKKCPERSIKSAIEKGVHETKIESKPLIVQTKTSLTTGTVEIRALECEKNTLKESKTAIKSKETSKSLSKEQQESPSHSQDNRPIKQSNENLAIGFPDQRPNSPNSVNKSRADGKSVTSKTSVNTANISESTRRVEEVNTECDGKSKSHIATDINPQKKISKPNEENKHVRVVSTSFGKKSCKELSKKSITSSFDVPKEKVPPTSVRKDALKPAIEQVGADGNTRKISKSSIDKGTDGAGPKDGGNAEIKSLSEQTAKSKKNEKPYLKTEKCELFKEDNNYVHTKVKEPDNSSKVFKGADQQSISVEVKSRDISDTAISKDDNSTSVICDEQNSQNARDLISTISDPVSELRSKELQESPVNDSKLSKVIDAETSVLNEQDPITSKTLTEIAVGLIEPHGLIDEQKEKNYKNYDIINITKSKGDVCENKDIDVQQDAIGTNDFKSGKDISEISSNLKTMEPNSKAGTTNVIHKNMETLTETDAWKQLETKQDIKDACRSEEVSAEISNLGATFIDSTDERKQTTSDTRIEEAIQKNASFTETNATVEENLNTSAAEGSTLLDTQENDLNKSPALSIRQTRSSKPDEILVQEGTKVLCNTLKTADTKDVETKHTYIDTRQSKNTKSEETDMSNKDQLKLSNLIREESKEDLAKTDKLFDVDPKEIDKSIDQNYATSLKNVMRKTRSTANTEDVLESYSMVDTKLHLSNISKTNDNTIKTPQRNIRKNRSTPSKCEDLEEDSKSKELIVSMCKNVSLDEVTQNDAIMDNHDDNDANKSARKKNRKTRKTSDPKADNTSKIIIGDYEPHAFNANKDECTKSKPKLQKKGDPIMLGSDSDKIGEHNIKEISGITVECIRNENLKTKSTDSAYNLPPAINDKYCANEPTSKKILHFKDDENKEDCEPIPNLEPASTISKNTDALTPGSSYRDTSFSEKNARDLLINEVKSTNVSTKTDLQKHSDKQVESTINTNLKTSVAKTGLIPVSTTSKESLEILTLSKCFSDAGVDLSAERARTLRKRGTPSSFCEIREGATKSLFKTPTSIFESCKTEAVSAPEVKMKRRLRSPAAEQALQTPLSKKSKTDIRKARNRNDVGIFDASESSSDVAAEQLPGTSKETCVLSPRRSIQKQSDSTPQAQDIKTNMSKSCEFEETAKEPVGEDRISSEKINQLTSNLIDVDTSSSANKGLSDTKEKKINPGMSKTYPDKELLYPEKRPSCSILSFAEWLRGNNRNDASEMQNQSFTNTASVPTELSDTSKPIGLQEFILKNPIETVPEQVTKLHSHISRQVSPKRGRKVKSISNSRGADNKQSVESNPRELVVNRAIEDVPEAITKPITKKLSQTPPKADTSPKRGRKIKTMSIVQTETASDDVATRKIESDIAAFINVKDTKLKICMKAEQDITAPQEKTTTHQLHSASTVESIGAEKVRDANENDNLSVSISSPSLKYGRRRPKIRRGRLLVAGTANKDQQKVKSVHPTRQDKKPIKRSEIDILIESMPKEMKDAGISDLLNNSGNVKRQRAVVKRANASESTYLNPATLASNETVAKEKITKDASSIIESVGSSNTVEEISKKSPTRRSLSKKLIITKESNKNEINSESIRPMEMEKALIDEAEIRNMNTSFLEPLKCEPTKQHRPSSKLALKSTPSLQNCGFKTPKPLTTINRIKSAEDVSQLYRGNDNIYLSGSVRRTSSLKCGMLKIRLNRRVVKKYLQNLRQVDISNTSFISRTEPTQKSSSTTVVAQLPEVKENSNIIEAKVLKATNKDPGEAFNKKQQSLITHKTIPSPALPDESNNMNNAARGNSRNEETLPDSVMEPMAPIELKNEFLDENPNSLGDTTLPDTPTLIARSQTITQAAASALSNSIMPTDIRLLSNDPMSTRAYVPSFGVTPTLVDAKGALMYTFLHPAKYSRNHGNVLLDYCCPNLDGPMPAIDPTRIHAQVQIPVIELPSCIVLTTKVVTRAELDSKSSTIPAVIRKKAEKLRSNFHQSLGAPHETAINTVSSQSPRPLQLHSQQITNSTHPQALASAMKPSHISNAPHFSPAINALAKYLPSTTTITAKIRPPLSPPPLTLPVPNTNQHSSSLVPVATKVSAILSETQSNLLRSNLRRVDVLFKSLVQPFEKLNFTERHRIIDSLVASEKFLPKDLERTIVLMEEYLKQITEFQKKQITNSGSSSNIVNTIPTQLANLGPIQMPPLQPAPKLVSSTFKVDSDQNVEQVHNTAIRKVQSTVKQHNTTVNTTTVKQRQVPIYDTERNIIGYQLQVITPATTMPSYTKSTLSTTSGSIMSSSLGASSNHRKSLKRPAQDSPRVFYTSQPMKTSTPNANLNSMQYSTTPMTANQNAQTIAKSQKGSIVTTVRSAGATSAGTETITTTTMATVKRVTRSRAAGSKIVIVSKSNSNEETILPDVNHQTEIKHEKDVEDFMA